MSLSHKAHSPNAPGDEAVGKSSPKSATPELKRRILVPIADGSEEIETMCITDTLSRFGAEVLVASCMPQVGDKVELVCTMSRGVKIMADITIDKVAADEYDAIILPGGVMGARNLRQCEPLISLLQRQKKARKLYGGICAAPAIVLATAGLLGPGATCYPAKILRDEMEDPADEAVVVQEAGTLITSQGPGTSLRFALQVGEELFGKAKADSVARKLLVDRDEPLYGDSMTQEFPPKNCHVVAPQIGYGEANDSSDGSGRGKRNRSSQEESVLKTSRKKALIPEMIMFNEVIWPVLYKMGWKIDKGTRSGDKHYFLRPAVSRHMKGAKKNIDYFDSREPVLEHLRYLSPHNKDIRDCLEVYDASFVRGPDLEAFGKSRKFGCTTEWLVKELKYNPLIAEVPLFDSIVLPQLKELGWVVEEAGLKMFYLPPSVSRDQSQFTEGVDYFTTRAEVMNFLKDDDTWGNMTEVLRILDFFQACVSIGKELSAEGKLADDYTISWLCTEAKRRRPALRDDEAPNAKKVTCALFDHLIWPELEKMGWHIEMGNRPTDKYFCKPKTHRGKPYKNRLDFFDSVKQVFECLKFDKEWSSKDEVKGCLEKYRACQAAKNQCKALGTLPKDWSPEWLLNEAKQLQESMTK